MYKFLWLLFLLTFYCHTGYAQNESSSTKREGTFFVGYELGEAAFNKFQSLSGEVGFRFQNQYMFRLTHMNVKLSEEHLSSSFAGAVEGDQVVGDFLGFEAFYDMPVLFNGFYISPSCGYYENKYRHQTLNDNLVNKSLTFGAAISYRENNLFKLQGLYYMISFPMRTPINPITETKLGDTIIKNNSFDNNIWLFIGYEF